MLDQSCYKKADEIIEHYEKCAASLIPIMQDIQAEYRYLPARASDLRCREDRRNRSQGVQRSHLL